VARSLSLKGGAFCVACVLWASLLVEAAHEDNVIWREDFNLSPSSQPPTPLPESDFVSVSHGPAAHPKSMKMGASQVAGG